MNCLNCKDHIHTKKIEKNTTVTCTNCGCIMRCLDKNEYIYRWRVINPFDIEDKRNS